MSNTFHKQERLCSKKQIDLLFSEGRHAVSYPLKMVSLPTPVNLQYPAQAMFVVPKRQFKKAPVRNKLKRRMREVYRLNKSDFYQNLLVANKKLILAFIFIGKTEEDYPVIEKALLKLLKKFQKADTDPVK